jgi:hypothetical protein
MGKRSFQCPVWSPTATADTTALANNTMMTIGALNATSGLLVQEIEIGGQGSASSPMIMMFARDSTLGATPTALAAPNSDGPLHTLGQTTQSGSITFNFATTSPQRSAVTTSARLNLTFNGFGGIVRWQAAPYEEWGIIGVTVSVSESSLSSFTGSTPSNIGAHIIYENYNS